MRELPIPLLHAKVAHDRAIVGQCDDVSDEQIQGAVAVFCADMGFIGEPSFNRVICK